MGRLDEARELLKLKQPEAAWEAALTAMARRPFHPEAFLLLAEIALAAGAGRVAKQCAQRARDLAPGWKPVRQFLCQPLKGDTKPEWMVLPDPVSNSKAQTPSRLSICLIVKNEERFLAQCLKSVRGLAAQIVVVDTGSTDRTVEIAREFGAEIYSFGWCDDFGAARNAALEHATGEWVLMLDADEELPAAQHARLLADMKNAAIIAFRLPLVNAGQENEGRSFVPRLFRNAPGVFFAGRIHEQVFSSLLERAKQWGLKTALGSAELLHHGYSQEILRDRNKIERNLKLLGAAIAENPTDPNLLMNLGLELVRSNNLAAGVEKYRGAYELMSAQEPAEVPPELREVLLTQFTSQLYKVQNHEEVVRVLNSPLAKRSGLTASLHFALGLAYFELKQFSEAADQMRQCLAKRKQSALTPINTDILTAAPQHCLALCLAKLGDAPAAEKTFEAALAATGSVEAVRLDYAKFLRTENRALDALHQLHALVTAHPKNLAAWQLGAEIALGQADYLQFARDWTGEACRALPENPALASLCAEALLLTGDAAGAAQLWEKIWRSEPDPRTLAALILCAASTGQTVRPPSPGPDENATSLAFVAWYQKLIAIRAHPLIENINGRLELLSRTLPSAAQMLQAALSEAVAPVATLEIITGGEDKPLPAQPAAPKAMPAVARLGQLNEARELFGRKNFEAAWAAALTAVAQRPFHPEAFLLLAEIALAAGAGRMAEQCAQRARDFAPGWQPARQFLCQPLKSDAKPGWLDASRLSPHASRLSVCLIVKNEERFLAQCLKSVRGLAAQIVVVDTGSTDRTMEIAREFGAEIYSFAWCDDFAAARNASLEHATGDWILILDADEELPAAQHPKLIADMKDDTTIALRLPRVDAGQEQQGRGFTPRLFRNAPEVFYRGCIHEQAFPSLLGSARKWGLKIGLGTAEIVHHGSAVEVLRDRNKIERNLKLLRAAAAESPDDANLLMNLGMELVRSDELAAGIEKYREAYDRMSAQPVAEVAPELREALLTQFTFAKMQAAHPTEKPELREALQSQSISQPSNARSYEEVVEILTSPLAQHGGLTASLHFALGMAYFELKEFNEAADQMRQCIAKRRQPCLTLINTDILTASPQHCLARCLVVLDDLPGAEKAFVAAVAETVHTDDARMDYAIFLGSHNRPVDALTQLHALVTANPKKLAAWQLGAEIALSRADHLPFARDWTGEAFKALPENPVIAAQRAEALMLNCDPGLAMQLWDKIWRSEPDPRTLAALILCATSAGQPARSPSPGPDEQATSMAFVTWYQKLIAVQAKPLIQNINGQLELLARTLPTAAQMLGNALGEVQAETATAGA
jgi:glycosyltransferase involved in cell wall biosynthesis